MSHSVEIERKSVEIESDSVERKKAFGPPYSGLLSKIHGIHGFWNLCVHPNQRIAQIEPGRPMPSVEVGSQRPTRTPETGNTAAPAASQAMVYQAITQISKATATATAATITSVVTNALTISALPVGLWAFWHKCQKTSLPIQSVAEGILA